MSAKKKHHAHAALVIILCLIAIILVAVFTAYKLISRKLDKLSGGVDFNFAYTITPTADSPALYSVLQQVGATDGTVKGQYTPEKLQVQFYQTSNGKDQPFTRLYITNDETLFDVGQLYRYARNAVVNIYPLASLVLPTWSMGDYISQTQLANVLGVELSAVEMQSVSDFTLALGSLKKVTPDNAIEGYTYFELSSGDDAAVMVIGLPLKSFFDDSIPVHIILTIPAHSVNIELNGSISSQTVAITAPTSLMTDDEVNSFVEVRELLTEIINSLQGSLSQQSG